MTWFIGRRLKPLSLLVLGIIIGCSITWSFFYVDCSHCIRAVKRNMPTEVVFDVSPHFIAPSNPSGNIILLSLLGFIFEYHYSVGKQLNLAVI